MNRLALCATLRSWTVRGFLLWATFLILAMPNVPAASIAAQWDFNDPANGPISVASTGGYEVKGIIIAPLTRTTNGEGVSSRPGDYGLVVGVLAGMTPTSPGFFTALNSLAGSQALSITYWFRGSITNEHLLISSPSAPSGRGLSVAAGVGLFSGLAFDTSTQRLDGRLNPGELASNSWHFLAFVYDHGAKQVYYDSELRGSGAGNLPLVTDFNSLRLGGGPSGTVDNFTIWAGSIDRRGSGSPRRNTGA